MLGRVRSEARTRPADPPPCSRGPGQRLPQERGGREERAGEQPLPAWFARNPPVPLASLRSSLPRKLTRFSRWLQKKKVPSAFRDSAWLNPQASTEGKIVSWGPRGSGQELLRGLNRIATSGRTRRVSAELRWRPGEGGGSRAAPPPRAAPLRERQRCRCACALLARETPIFRKIDVFRLASFPRDESGGVRAGGERALGLK